MDNATADTVQAAGWAITYLTIRMFLAEMNRAMTTNRLDGHTRPYWIRGSSEYIETKHYKRLYSGVTGTMSSSRVVTYGLTERFTMKPAHEFDKLLRGDEVQ